MNNTLVFLLASSLFPIGSACSTARETSSNSLSGSSVNNGPGPAGSFLTCSGSSGKRKGDRLSFEIRSTAVPTFIQGLLKIDKDVIDMKCVDEVDSPETPEGQRDGQVNLWSCTELGHIDGLYHVLAYRQGNSAIILADVTHDQKLGDPKPVASLGCKAPKE